MNIISVKGAPALKQRAIAYFQQQWATDASKAVYENCITNSMKTERPLPQWYVPLEDDTIIGCAGLITNDFISRMDLYPWICAIFVEEAHRGQRYSEQLIARAKQDATRGGFSHVYVCTGHIGLYEKYGFTYIGDGFHPWGASSRIYEATV